MPQPRNIAGPKESPRVAATPTKSPTSRMGFRRLIASETPGITTLPTMPPSRSSAVRRTPWSMVRPFSLPRPSISVKTPFTIALARKSARDRK